MDGRRRRLVYYRKKRLNERVVSVYVGSGEVGERAEREDRERREAIETLRRTALAPPLISSPAPRISVSFRRPHVTGYTAGAGG